MFGHPRWGSILKHTCFIIYFGWWCEVENLTSILDDLILLLLSLIYFSLRNWYMVWILWKDLVCIWWSRIHVYSRRLECFEPILRRVEPKCWGTRCDRMNTESWKSASWWHLLLMMHLIGRHVYWDHHLPLFFITLLLS